MNAVKKHNEEQSKEIQILMVSHGITKTQLAKEAGCSYRTIWLWLAKGMNDIRFEALKLAISRIVEKGENK